VNAHLKVACLVAGDSIDDMDVLRHGAMSELFAGIRAPSTLGSFLRSFTWGHVRQLDAVARRMLAELARQTPLLPGGEAPVIAATRLRGGSANSARGAASLATEAISAARQAGCSGRLVARIGPAYHSAAVLGAIRSAGAYFSVTVPLQGQGELFTAWRYHAVFTDSPFVTLQAEEHHRGHAQAEQVFADWTDGPLAHLPSGSFPANAAWLALAAISCNLLRAAGALASLTYAKARGATVRRDLINVAARTARHGRGHLTLHLPEGWHRKHEWMNLLEAACGPPAAAA